MSDTNFYSLKIAEVQPETDSAIAVSFAVPEELQETFKFKQGQFLTLRAKIDGEDVRRSYSICSGINDGELRVGIKRMKAGMFSNFANDTFAQGVSVDVMPPQGRFYTEIDPNQAKNYLCIATGSGITPLLSIIKSVLDNEPNSNVTLIYGNRRSNSIMFKDELNFVKNRHLQRFQWINMLTYEDQGNDLMNGRIDNSKWEGLKKAGIVDPSQMDEAFLCGPEEMTTSVAQGLQEQGMAKENIHFELFGTAKDVERAKKKQAAKLQAESGEAAGNIEKADTNFYSLKILDVQAETDEAIAVSLAVPNELKEKFTFIQGQFLTLRANIEGEEVRRSYSISSGVNDSHLRVGIKRVKEGKFSNYANDQLKPGMSLDVMPPQGTFYTELKPENQKHYLCIAVGSGITPMLSILKSALSTEPESKVTLLYGNRRGNSIMFKDELNFVKNRYMERFQWINILSYEDQGADLLNGRITNEKGYDLQKFGLLNIHDIDEAFMCGPEDMITNLSDGFLKEGLTEDHIHYELFTASAADAEAVRQRAAARAEQFGDEQLSRVTVISDGRSVMFDLAAAGDNILDAGMDNGMDLPYSCKGGVCSTCKCKVIKGEVDMDISHGLEQHEIDAGYVLSCQAHPLSNEVVVDFDAR